MEKWIKTILVSLIAVFGVLLLLHAWQLPPFRTQVVVTEDAYIRGQVTIISPRVSGYVTQVPVLDYQRVKKGDLLVQIDDRILSQRLLQAEADLAQQRAGLAVSEQNKRSAEAKIRASEALVASAKVALDTAQANFDRTSSLEGRGVATQASLDAANSTLSAARAAVAQAQAAVDVAHQDLATIIVNRSSIEAAIDSAQATHRLAEIDVENTRIIAPRNGKLGEVGVQIGQYVTAGTQLMSIVPDTKWVVANFKETQLYNMEVGQPVTFKVDAIPNVVYHGRIQDYSGATAAEFSILKPDNATGNFTKVAQRLSIRISIDPDQQHLERLLPGLSVVVRTDKASEPFLSSEQ
ncbi:MULTISPECIES: HlyD family secretion protein [unclassified Bradyrhizobium]|uniref:HlyD family secretion protein n=1 Tax=unclassified Bradyrhizobium TaxID=2631580 RepID=UPI00247ACA02|nr:MULTISPECIES: HlyD family secretion protein [unclassified Bradyrhizobium]WGR73108.1 HlyD family secretion protein [Bradyrhizobium sp. ISRA426]WGR77948.1 HlyD family secretion protein [Bradyrhizobium sp. ISRA430]WGR88349.1 HlyD family secretion protein [Bradyrhizobium sp. ISRA432]